MEIIIIPKLVSCKIKDLIEIFSEKYNKPIKITGLRPGEKLLESLINETQSTRLFQGKNDYLHIKPIYIKLNNKIDNIRDYNSKLNPFNKNQLRKYLKELKLL